MVERVYGLHRLGQVPIADVANRTAFHQFPQTHFRWLVEDEYRAIFVARDSHHELANVAQSDVVASHVVMTDVAIANVVIANVVASVVAIPFVLASVVAIPVVAIPNVEVSLIPRAVVAIPAVLNALVESA